MNALAELLLRNAKLARNVGIVFAALLFALVAYTTGTCLKFPFVADQFQQCDARLMTEWWILRVVFLVITGIAWAFAAMIGIVGGILTFVLHMMNKK